MSGFQLGALLYAVEYLGPVSPVWFVGPYEGVKKSIQLKTNKIKSANYELKNGNQFSKAIEVSQSPIGKTSRSTPVTYLGVLDSHKGAYLSFTGGQNTRT